MAETLPHRLRTLSAVLAVFVLSSLARAQEIIVWQALPGSNRIVLPILNGETPARAVEKYFESIGGTVPNLSRSTYKKLPPLKISDRTRVVIQANMPEDIRPTGSRISEILDLVDAQKTKGYVVPVAAVRRLAPREQERFENLLYDQFDMRMNIGGDDIHPSLYGEKITHARKGELDLTRDQFEIQLIRRWQARNDRALAQGIAGKPEFGICRGHQIMAVASGHSMYQDIVRDGASRDGTHLDRLGSSRPGMHWHHVFVQDSLFSELLGRKGKVLVNDYHHQSVKASALGRTYAVAVAPDGVVEAMESKDRLTLSVQFHPEIATHNVEFNEMGRGFFGRLFTHAHEHRVMRECSSVFRVAR